MTETPARLEAADIVKVLELLPHRYPFLLVDRIVEIDGDESCIGIKNVTYNEPQFTGHFPSQPVFPGVLLIEGMAQTAGAICVASKTAGEARPKQVYFMTIDKAKFRRPVGPGDQLRVHVVRERQRGNIWRFRAEAKVDGKVVAEATYSAMILDR